MHSEAWSDPVVVVYLPAPQSWQTDASDAPVWDKASYLPMAHAVQVAVPASAAYVPVSQLMQWPYVAPATL
jgi:hypothetical protein